MTWDRKIPFDEKGNLIVYPDYRGVPEWRDVYEVEMTLTFQYFSRGRSAARAVFLNEKKQRFEMFLSDIDTLIRDGSLKPGGVTKGNWTFCKRGANFGVCPAKA